jgi:hypothetical protein
MGCAVDADCNSAACLKMVDADCNRDGLCGKCAYADGLPSNQRNSWFEPSTTNEAAWDPQSVRGKPMWDEGDNLHALAESSGNVQYTPARCVVSGIQIGQIGARCMGNFVLNGPMMEQISASGDATPVYRMVKSNAVSAAEGNFLEQKVSGALLELPVADMITVQKREIALQNRVAQAQAEFDSTLWLIRIANAGKWLVAHRSSAGTIPCIEVDSKAAKPQLIGGQWSIFDMNGTPRQVSGVSIKCSKGTEPVFESKKQLRDYEELKHKYFTPSMMPTLATPNPTPVPTNPPDAPTAYPTVNLHDTGKDLYDFTNPYLEGVKPTPQVGQLICVCV